MKTSDRDNFIAMQQDITYLKEGQNEMKTDIKEIKDTIRKFVEDDAPKRFAPMFSWDLQRSVYGIIAAAVITYAVKVILSHNLTF
jgi:hypothetical protein